MRAELGIDENTHLLIFAGRGSKEKNLPVLLDCMKRLGRRYHLLLVGSSMPASVPDNVTVIDEFCPATQVARLMASADALLHAGDQETFGLVILEAMACGIPVVAVAAGAFRGNRQRSMWPALCPQQSVGDGQRGARAVQLRAAPPWANRPAAMSSSITHGTPWSTACWVTITPSSAANGR